MSVRVSKSKKWGFLEVDIRVRLPDGTRHRERVKSPVQSKSGAKRWGEERERYLALHGRAQPKEGGAYARGVLEAVHRGLRQGKQAEALGHRCQGDGP